MEEFKIGDVVKFKSGGFEMTVSRIEQGENATITCYWFSRHPEGDYNKTTYEHFPKGILEKV